MFTVILHQLFVLCFRLVWRHITIQASTSRKSTMTALSYTRPWRLKPDRWAPRSFLITWAVVSVVTSLVSSLPLSLCRRWASIRPAAFVLLQRRLGWMRWGTRWPGHTGTWQSSTWSDRRKFLSFSLCLISTRSVWIVETLLKVYSSEEKRFPSQSFSVAAAPSMGRNVNFLMNIYGLQRIMTFWFQLLYFSPELK